MEKQRALRINDELYEDIKKISEDRNTTANMIMIEAIIMYRDSYFLTNKISILSEDIQAVVKAEMELISSRDMNKIRSLVSQLAINMHVVQRCIAEQLDISPYDLVNYRQEATEILRENNRVFDLKEFIE